MPFYDLWYAPFPIGNKIVFNPIGDVVVPILLAIIQRTDAANLELTLLDTHRNNRQSNPGARPTNDISIEFEIRPEFGVL